MGLFKIPGEYANYEWFDASKPETPPTAAAVEKDAANVLPENQDKQPQTSGKRRKRRRRK